MLNGFEKILTPDNVTFLLKGAGMSLLIAVIGLVCGVLIGIVIAGFRISRNRILKGIGHFYVEVIRGTPMLLQISFIYIGIPMVYTAITGGYLQFDPVLAGIVAISINSGAYTGELIRGSINSIDKGQWEAGKSLGLTHNQILRKIILPQSFKRIIPPLTSEFVTLIKDSSLVSTIGGIELMKAQKTVGNATFSYMEALMVASIFYLVMTLGISYVSSRLERKMAESD